MRLMLTHQLVALPTGEWLMSKNTSDGVRPSRQEVSALAYSFWEERGRAKGNDVDDWLRAERELVRHYT